MPWTIAHAAAVLPFRRSERLPFSALVAGSMAPDLGYYLGRLDLATAAHSLFPGPLLSIPLGLAMLAVWRLAGPSACAALPAPFRGELAASFEEDLAGSARALVLTCVALAIGALTHIAWDSFTHARGWFVYHAPAMRAPVSLGEWYSLPRYRLAQHLSTLLGTLVLLFAWRRAHRGLALREAWRGKPERIRLGLVAFLLVAASVAACLSAPVFDPRLRLEERLYYFAIAAPMWFAVLLCISGVLLGDPPEESATR